MTPSHSRPSTPPHHPNFGIEMSSERIKSLMHLVLPEVSLMAIQRLPPFKSYNNRIYYLKGSRQSCDALEGANSLEIEEYVLKINGRGFDADKTHNEVSCLRLLEAFCHRVPAPKVIAWSRDGSSIGVSTRNQGGAKLLQFRTADENHNGWILMTKVPGEPINLTEVNQSGLASLAVQLADHVTDWRQHIPAQMYGGNLRFYEDDYRVAKPDITLSSADGLVRTDLSIRGMLGDGLKWSNGIATTEGYYRARMENKLKVLEAEDTFAPNRSLAAPIRNLIQHGLPTIDKSNPYANSFVFTHYDLSPRNVLISGDPPQITGIVDFEFSGFFPPVDEFLNDYIGNSQDWTEEVYNAYLKRLEQNGVPTPLQGIDPECWEKAFLIEQLLQSIAPWYLPGSFRNTELEHELEKSKVLCHNLLERLGTEKSD
ncbi:hypothetical protein F66182_2196 [Fusarium sp. NRRL 66182]|nr:hypothetical protein F66182_2196 [Fusarium sp. NRRL 66182]